MALCPGVTETNFFDAGKMERPPMRGAQTPEEVVATALRGLRRRRASMISGWINVLMVVSQRLIPRGVVLKIAGKALRRRFD